MSDDATNPPSTEPSNQSESKKSQPTEKPESPKKTSWREWLLIFIAAMSLGNGVAEVMDVQRDKQLARQHIEISQHFQREAISEQQAKRQLYASTEGQVTTIKDFMARNQAEIASVDHYQRQLTTLSRTAINIANESIAKRNTDDALTKAMKAKIAELESLLAQDRRGREKAKFEEVYELASKTEELLKLNSAFFAKAINGSDHKPLRM